MKTFGTLQTVETPHGTETELTEPEAPKAATAAAEAEAAETIAMAEPKTTLAARITGTEPRARTGGTERRGATARAVKAWFRALWARRLRSDAGMTTAEYAMGTIAACAFAAVLYKVVTSGSVQGALESLIGQALSAKA